MAKNYITIKEAAELMEVSVSTLRNWDKNGKFPTTRNPSNNHRTYSISEIEKFFKKTILKKTKNS